VTLTKRVKLKPLIGDQPAITVGIDDGTGRDDYPCEAQHNITFAQAALIGSARHKVKGSHPERAGIEFIGISNTAIDDGATPAVVLTQLCQLAANQRAALKP